MIYAEILAGGKGTRMGNTAMPKQFLMLGGKPIFVHTVEQFLMNTRIDEIIMDSDYRTFVSFSEEWSMYNIMYVDYAEKFRYFDEKKYVMAIK